MGKRHNTLNDDIFRNSKYIATLEKELGIDNFKKESKKEDSDYYKQYDIMLDIFQTFILSNNIFFADRDRTNDDIITDLQIQLEQCIYGDKDNDSKRLKYTKRQIKSLVDSFTRQLYNNFIRWYDYLETSTNLSMIQEEIENIMSMLESVGFDNIVKQDIDYTKNKNSNYKIYISKFSELYPNKNTFLSQYKSDFYKEYRIDLNDTQTSEIALIFNLIAYANNGITNVLENEPIKECKFNDNTTPQELYKTYLDTLHINSDNLNFKLDSASFMLNLEIINKRLNIPFEAILSNYSLFYFINKMYKIINNDISLTISEQYLKGIIEDLKDIYNLISQEPNSFDEMMKDYNKALKIVQDLIKLKENMFERCS